MRTIVALACLFFVVAARAQPLPTPKPPDEGMRLVESLERAKEHRCVGVLRGKECTGAFDDLLTKARELTRMSHAAQTLFRSGDATRALAIIREVNDELATLRQRIETLNATLAIREDLVEL